MTPIEQCVEKTVDLMTFSGRPKPVRGYVYGDLVLHEFVPGRPEMGWKVSHLPSGFGISGRFRSRDDAAEAMIALQRLRNDWAVLDVDAFMKDTDSADAVRAICARHGCLIAAPTGKHRDLYDTTLNGYEPACTAREASPRPRRR